MDTSAIPLSACATCGSRLSGLFCSACGQRVLESKHTLWTLTRGVVVRLIDLEHGVAHTVSRLTVQPEVVIRGYISGRTVPYTHPFAYLVLAFAVVVIGFGSSASVAGGDNRVFSALIVLFLAAASRIAFRGSGLNYAEHLILNIYLFAHAALLMGGALLAVTWLPAPARAPFSIAMLALGCVYFVWGYSRVFPRRPLFAAAGGLAALGAGTLLWLLFLAVILELLRALRPGS
jgi:hypothetical protein